MARCCRLEAMSRKSVTAEQETGILRLRSQGQTIRAIAGCLGLSKAAVQRVLDRARVPGQPVQRRAGGTHLQVKSFRRCPTLDIGPAEIDALRACKSALPVECPGIDSTDLIVLFCKTPIHAEQKGDG